MKSIPFHSISCFFTAVLLFSPQARAAVITAESCEEEHVQAAVDGAADGDIVAIPEGTCTWTSGVSIGEITDWNPPVTIESKALTLLGAGMDRTVIVNELPYSSSGTDDSPIIVTSLEGKPFRISGLTLRGGAEDTGTSDHGAIRIGGTCKAWRVDHVKFDHLRTRAIRTSGNTLGVIDHCEFITDQWAQFIYIDHSSWDDRSWGDGSWSSPLSLGTDQAIYIEDNVFTWDGGDTPVEALDCGGGGRFVFRFNEVNLTSFGNHGTETTGRYRSCFSYEIYGNTFARPVEPSRWTLFLNRGGTGVMYDNTATGSYDSLAHVANFRDYHNFESWGACDGTSPYDVNDGETHEAGAHTGASGAETLTCDGRTWTDNEWVGYSLHNTTQGWSTIITGNGAATIDYQQDQYGDPLTFEPGDTFTVLRATPCLDQVGRSAGTLLSGDPPAPSAWPDQALEPFYEWNNTINGENADIVSDSPHLVENRDYYNDTERPEYAPFTYPHPLTLTTCGELGGACCSAGETCEGGVSQESSDCPSLCCVGGTCAVSDAVPDAPADASQDTVTDPAADAADEDGGGDSGCGCAMAR